MAEYKLVDIEQLEANLTTIANDIRAKIGSESKLDFPIDFSNTIRNISNIRAVTGSFTVAEDWGSGGTTSADYTIECPIGANIFVMAADDATVQAIKARTVTKTTYFTLGINCIFTNDYTDVNQWPCTLSALAAAPSASRVACAGVEANNTNGITFNAFLMATGTYNWIAYYWDENMPDSSSNEDYLASVINRECVELINNKVTQPLWSSFQEGNKKLTRVSLPYCPELKNSVFSTCSNLTEIHLPSVTAIGSNCFAACSMTSLYMPFLSTIATGGWGWNFSSTSTLQRVYFPLLTNLMNSDFSGDRNLTTVILGAPTVCTLAHTNAFNGTAIAAGTGYIYVPRTLVDSYKTATNWSTYANQIRAIEDYPEVLEDWE